MSTLVFASHSSNQFNPQRHHVGLHGRLCLNQRGYEEIEVSRIDVADGDNMEV
jgi:hypothetical protein